ncbi:MAG TPA: HesA/MoeB/ThiF family protein [Sedimentisphaerales bacterium]|nr:HesA/MoeB/ThiF family protein [Sedimentisphaerales bacterium]
MALSRDEHERYSRQLVVPEIGEAGQKKLRAGRVLIIGAGGLGSPAAFYLAAVGVGRMGIVDSDAVELSNLQRQVIHRTEDIGRSKAVSAQEKVAALNPEVRVDVHQMKVEAGNIAALIDPYDFVIDATDNFTAKFLINDGCVAGGKAFCHAGVIRMGGQMMTVLPGRTACYRCVFGGPPPAEAVPPPSVLGIFGIVPGVIGMLEAMEAAKYLLGTGGLLTDALLTYDAVKAEFRKVPVKRNPGCPACGGGG